MAIKFTKYTKIFHSNVRDIKFLNKLKLGHPLPMALTIEVVDITYPY
jgi:hypothetical protein